MEKYIGRGREVENMRMETNNLVNLSVANRDFGRVRRKAESNGGFCVIQRYGEPLLVLIEIERLEEALEKLGFEIVPKVKGV